jgi:hypothetical protein
LKFRHEIKQLSLSILIFRRSNSWKFTKTVEILYGIGQNAKYFRRSRKMSKKYSINQLG